MQRKMAVHQPAWVKFSNCVELSIVSVNKASTRCEREGGREEGEGEELQTRNKKRIQKKGGWCENKIQDCGTISPNSWTLSAPRTFLTLHGQPPWCPCSRHTPAHAAAAPTAVAISGIYVCACVCMHIYMI